MNRTCKTLVLLTALLGFTAHQLCADDLKLPPPQTKGGMPLFEALAKRSTARSFDKKDLSDQQVSSLLWACFGVNRADGKRTAPSALNKQEIDIYVLLSKGAYLYDALSNHLKLVSSADLRKLGGTQDFVTNAPLTMILVADLSKMADGNESAKLNTTYLDAGYISQNAYLFCASEGLVTGARLSVDRAALSKALKLRSDQVVIMGQSVGYLK